MFRPTITAALAALALAGAGLAVPTATAAPADPPKPKTLAKGLVTPLSVAVAPDGTVFYSQNFAGQIHSWGRARSRSGCTRSGPRVTRQAPSRGVPAS